MAVLKIKRGTSAALAKYTPADGELVLNTDTNSLVRGDGKTVGGVQIGTDHASTADKATNADHATKADTATNATNADHAKAADTATSATSATSAGKLSTSRQIKLSGAVTGAAGFDGSGDATINATLSDVDLGTLS